MTPSRKKKTPLKQQVLDAESLAAVKVIFEKAWQEHRRMIVSRWL